MTVQERKDRDSAEGSYLLDAARGALADPEAQCRYYEALIRGAWAEVFPDQPFTDFQDAMHRLKWSARKRRLPQVDGGKAV